MKRISPRILIASIGLMSVFLGLAVRAATRTDDAGIEILSPSQMDYDPFAPEPKQDSNGLESLPSIAKTDNDSGDSSQARATDAVVALPPVDESEATQEESVDRVSDTATLQNPDQFIDSSDHSNDGVVRFPAVSDAASTSSANVTQQKPPTRSLNHPYLAEPSSSSFEEPERFPSVDQVVENNATSNRRGSQQGDQIELASNPGTPSPSSHGQPLHLPPTSVQEAELLPPVQPMHPVQPVRVEQTVETRRRQEDLAAVERFPSTTTQHELSTHELESENAITLLPTVGPETNNLATSEGSPALTPEQFAAQRRDDLEKTPLVALPTQPSTSITSSRRDPSDPESIGAANPIASDSEGESQLAQLPTRPLPVIQARLNKSDFDSLGGPSVVQTSGFGGDEDPYSLANLNVRAQPIPTVESRPVPVSRNSSEDSAPEIERVEVATLPIGLDPTKPFRLEQSNSVPSTQLSLPMAGPGARTLATRANVLSTTQLEVGSARIPDEEVPNEVDESGSNASSNRRSSVVQREAPYVREFPRATAEQIARAREESEARVPIQTVIAEKEATDNLASPQTPTEPRQSSIPQQTVVESPVQPSNVDDFELPRIPEFAIQNSQPSSRRTDEPTTTEGRQVNWQGQGPATANPVENAQLNESPSDRRVRSPLAELTQQNLPAEYRESPPIRIQEEAVPTPEGSDAFGRYGNEFIEEPFADDLLADPFSHSANCRTGCVPKYYAMADLVAYRPDLGRLSISNVIDTDQAFFREGARVTLGYKSDCTYGWEASFLHLTHAADISSSTVSGVTGPLSTRFIPTAGFTNADLSSFNSPAAQVHVQDHRYQFTNFELHRTTWGWDVVNTQWGLRVMHMQEDVAMGSSPIGQAFELMPGRFQQSITNLLIGPQFGMTLIDDSRRAITFDLTGKLGGYANLLDLDTLYANNNQVLLNRRGVDEVKFAVSAEMSTGISWNLTPNWKIRGGLDLLWVYGVGTLNAQQLGAPAPNQGGVLLSGGTGALLRNDDDLFLWGGTIGLYGNWP